MRRGHQQALTRPRLTGRGGLALPTVMAAVLCGSSVLTVALTGIAALSGEPVAEEVLTTAVPREGLQRPPLPASIGTSAGTSIGTSAGTSIGTSAGTTEEAPVLVTAPTASDYLVDFAVVTAASGPAKAFPDPSAHPGSSQATWSTDNEFVAASDPCCSRIVFPGPWRRVGELRCAGEPGPGESGPQE
jgi:hypothetical protein